MGIADTCTIIMSVSVDMEWKLKILTLNTLT